MCAEPGHPDPLTGRQSLDPWARAFDAPDDLVAGHKGQPGSGKLAVYDMQVGAADPAGLDPDQDLARRRLRQVSQLEARPSTREYHGSYP